MLMVSISHALIVSRRSQSAHFSVIDLKSEFRGRKYCLALLNLLPETPSQLLIDAFFAKLGSLGSVNLPLTT